MFADCGADPDRSTALEGRFVMDDKRPTMFVFESRTSRPRAKRLSGGLSTFASCVISLKQSLLWREVGGRCQEQDFIARHLLALSTVCVRILVSLLALIVASSSCIGREPLRVGDVVLQTEREPRLYVTIRGTEFHGQKRVYSYTVSKVEGDWIYLENDSLDVLGWGRAQDFVPLRDGVEYFTDKMKSDPHRVFPYLMRARCYRLEGLVGNALRDLNDAVRLFPQSAAAYSNRASALTEDKDYPWALIDINRAFELKPDAYNLIQRAVVLKRVGLNNDAIDDLSHAILLDPSNIRAHLLRGQEMRRLGELAKAISDLNAALQVNPEYILALNERGLCWYGLAEYDKAIRDFDKALKIKGNYAYAYNNRALAWAGRTEYDKAIHDFNEAIRLSPSYAGAFANRALVWLHGDNLDRAVSDADEAIRINARLSDGYQIRAEALYRKRDYESSIRDYKIAIGLAPANASGFADLAWLLATCPSGQWRDGNAALEYAKQACKLSGWKDPSSLASLAVSYAETGEFRMATSTQEDAIRLADEKGNADADFYASVLTSLRAGKAYRD
jgi:tetratricopeptide (TPR) repeat protein